MSKKTCETSKRRTRLGIGIANWKNDKTRYYRTSVFNELSSDVFDRFVSDFGCDGRISLSDRFLLQRNGKKALAMRTISDLDAEAIGLKDLRREWNRERSSETVLDKYFTSFKYSYSSVLPHAHGKVSLVVSSKGQGRTADIARSHSIWLDAVDAPKELYKYRLRLNRIINWAYKMKLAPVMMTLTVFHRWHPLRELLAVIRKSWSDFFSSYSGKKRVAAIGLRGWIRRLEVTINDGRDDATNTGWHPHYHAILFVPKENLKLLDSLESEWQEAWVRAVCKQFDVIFDEKISEGYLSAFRRHGLRFSRVRGGLFRGQIRCVDNTEYLAKIMGCSSVALFGGDVEMTSAAGIKRSRTPFDLLRDSSLPATNVDLWVEYALATKGISAFSFSKGLEKGVNDYFADHPEFDTTGYKKCPKEYLVGSLDLEVYYMLYRNFKLDELREKIGEGEESLKRWLREVFVELGVPELCGVMFSKVLTFASVESFQFQRITSRTASIDISSDTPVDDNRTLISLHTHTLMSLDADCNARNEHIARRET